MIMNGVISASVSAVSSQRVASVTWTPHVIVPAGWAAAGAASRSSSDRARIARPGWIMAGSIVRPRPAARAPFRTADTPPGLLLGIYEPHRTRRVRQDRAHDESVAAGADGPAGRRSRHDAYVALRATLHALRDRLPVEETAELAAQLPMLVRGVYYEGWDPTGKPVRERSLEGFLAGVAVELPIARTRSPSRARSSRCSPVA